MLTLNGQVARRSTNRGTGVAKLTAPLAQATSGGYWAMFFDTLMRALGGMAV